MAESEGKVVGSVSYRGYHVVFSSATFGFCYGTTLGPINMLAGDIFGVGNIAHLQGWLGPIIGLGVGLSPFVFGVIYTETGSYVGAFAMSIGALVVAIVTLFILSVPKRKAIKN